MLQLRLAGEGLQGNQAALLYHRMPADEPDEGGDFLPASGEGQWVLIGQALADVDGKATFEVPRTGTYALALALPNSDGRGQEYDLLKAFDEEILQILAVEKSTAYVLFGWSMEHQYWADDATYPEVTEWAQVGAVDQPFEVRLEDHGKTLRIRSEFANEAYVKVIFRDVSEPEWVTLGPTEVSPDGEPGPALTLPYGQCERRFASPIRVWITATCGKRKTHYKPRVLGPLQAAFGAFNAYTSFYYKIDSGYFAQMLVITDECTAAPGFETGLTEVVNPFVQPGIDKKTNGRALRLTPNCGPELDPDDCVEPACVAGDCAAKAVDCGPPPEPAACYVATGVCDVLYATCSWELADECADDDDCTGAGTCSECKCQSQCGDDNCDLAGGEDDTNCPQDCGCSNMTWQEANWIIPHKCYYASNVVSFPGPAPGGCWCDPACQWRDAGCCDDWDDVCAPVCGDNICVDVFSLETCSTCPEDCGDCPDSVCGNGVCETEKDETGLNCVADCGCVAHGWCEDPPSSGLACQCDAFTQTSCPDICDGCGTCSTCGDGICNVASGETCSNCTADCGACVCDGLCQPGEDALSCLEEMDPPEPGDAGQYECLPWICHEGYDYATINRWKKQHKKTACDINETAQTCPMDCL